MSRSCDWVMSALSAVLLNFSFQFSLFFSHAGNQAPAAAHVVYPISDIERCRKCGKYVPCTRRIGQGEIHWIDSNGKNGNRHHVEGYFGSEFYWVQAICNHCGVMAAWSRKTWKFCEQFLRFFGKTTPYAKIFKILFRKFSPPHRSTLFCSNFVKCCRRKIGEIVCYLPDQKQTNFGCLSNSRYCE